MTITYTIDDSLYINMTNRCTNRCSFCVRKGQDTMGDSGSLWFDGGEPSKERIWEDIRRRDLTVYKEIVFCGYGEPLMRCDDVIWLCERLKKAGAPPLRVNTNGHADLIAEKDTAPLFAGLVDIMSISLNAPDADKYHEICHSIYGKRAFDAVIAFARRCAEEKIPQVILSVVDILPESDIAACRKIAENIGVKLRVREEIK